MIEILSKNHYCFDPLVQDDDSLQITLMTCFKQPQSTEDSWLPYSKFLICSFYKNKNMSNATDWHCIGVLYFLHTLTTSL